MKDFVKAILQFFLSVIDDNIAKCADVLIDDFWSPSNEWYKVATDVQAIIKPIALTILTICFLIEFLKITVNMEVLKWEYMLKCLFKFVLARASMDIASYLLSAIYATASGWISQVGKDAKTTIGATAWDTLQDEVDKCSFMELIGLIATIMIVFLVIWIISIVVQIIAYARKFEIILHLAVAPIPCAFMPLEDGGASRIPKRYIMSFASVCLSGLFIIVSIKLFGLLCTKEIMPQIKLNEGGVGISITSFISIAGQLLMATVVMIMAVIKSSSWAQRLLDV